MSQEITTRQNSLLCFLKIDQEYKISDIEKFYSLFSNKSSLATRKRDLQTLVQAGFLVMSGKRRATVYKISSRGILLRFFDEGYLEKEITNRNARTEYNYDAFSYFESSDAFSNDEMKRLKEATNTFHLNGVSKSRDITKKELERFIIELSWKSSKIEGNTYSLLDTEFLIREGIESKTNTKEEAIMILNHKAAFSYILECKKQRIDIFTIRELENIHRLLVKDLEIDFGIRKNAVGITGSAYRPLSYDVQIEEEIKRLMEVLKRIESPFERALYAVLGISYLQPFGDGNKRTARLFSNAILLCSDLAPLSYRTVDEKKYREAALIFYEQNSASSMKEIFIEQYIFAANNYNIS
jgi:Fic family protein